MSAPDKPRPGQGKGGGGAKPGSGRKPTDSERLQMRVSRDTRVKLERAAKLYGVKQGPPGTGCVQGTGQGLGFWNAVFSAILSKLDLPEPEYLKLLKK